VAQAAGGTGGSLTPQPLPPQSPLGSLAIDHGAQYWYVGETGDRRDVFYYIYIVRALCRGGDFLKSGNVPSVPNYSITHGAVNSIVSPVRQ
jgi:hypothetical protein